MKQKLKLMDSYSVPTGYEKVAKCSCQLCESYVAELKTANKKIKDLNEVIDALSETVDELLDVADLVMEKN
jgi:hypothetical protein